MLGVSYLMVMIGLPIGFLIVHLTKLGPAAILGALSEPVALSAIRLTLWTACLMSMVNAVMGTIVAIVLVRYDFPGKAFINLLIDLPFAIPTLVTGVMIAGLYGPGEMIGGFFKENFGWDIIYAPAGIILALLFISFPFVVRAVQPLLLEMEPGEEEASRTLGASSWMTFRKVLLPALFPGILTGTLLSFARAVGEFGAVVIVAGNIPFSTQTASVYILGEIESGKPAGALTVSLVLISISFGLIWLVDFFRAGRFNIIPIGSNQK